MRIELSTRKQKNSTTIKNTSSPPCYRVGTNFALQEGLLNSVPNCLEALESEVYGPHVSQLRLCFVLVACNFFCLKILTWNLFFVTRDGTASVDDGKPCPGHICWFFRLHVALQLQPM